MKKKQFLSIGLLLLLLAGTLTSCKKGPEDPILSLRTRKARLTGTWNLSTADYSNVGKNYTETFSFNKETGIMSDNSKIGSLSYSSNYKYARVLTIKKDNTFSDSVTITDNGTRNTTKKGYWYFAPANKNLDVKNKERVIFQISRVDVNNNGNISFDVYDGATNTLTDIIDLTQLSNKQITIKLDYTQTNEKGLQYSTSGTETFTQK